ncbi:hypothetical protein DV515_00018657, partial [Chloebia gouldiae]
MEPRPGRAAGQQRGSPGSSQASAPSRARRQQLLAGPQGCAGRGGQGGAQGPAPTLPSCCSLQLADDSSRVAEYLRRALPYLESPQEPLREAALRFMGELPARAPSLPHSSLAPAPPAAPAAPSGPGASGSRALGSGPGLSPAAPGGHVAPGLAAPLAGSCALPGRDRLCVPRDGRVLPEGTASRASPSHSGGGWPGELQCWAGSCNPCPSCGELRFLCGPGLVWAGHREISGTAAQIPGPGTHRPLLRFSSMPSSVHTHRGRRAGEAGKVPVLKVHFHNTVELQILLSTLEPLGFGTANLRITWQASTEGKGAWNAESFQEELPESSAVPHPCTGSGRGQKQRPSGLHRELWMCLRANEAAAQGPRLGGMTLPCRDASRGSGGMPWEDRGLLLKESRCKCAPLALCLLGLAEGQGKGEAPLGHGLGKVPALGEVLGFRLDAGKRVSSEQAPRGMVTFPRLPGLKECLDEAKAGIAGVSHSLPLENSPHTHATCNKGARLTHPITCDTYGETTQRIARQAHSFLYRARKPLTGSGHAPVLATAWPRPLNWPRPHLGRAPAVLPSPERRAGGAEGKAGVTSGRGACCGRRRERKVLLGELQAAPGAVRDAGAGGAAGGEGSVSVRVRWAGCVGVCVGAGGRLSGPSESRTLQVNGCFCIIIRVASEGMGGVVEFVEKEDIDQGSAALSQARGVTLRTSLISLRAALRGQSLAGGSWEGQRCFAVVEWPELKVN